MYIYFLNKCITYATLNLFHKPYPFRPALSINACDIRLLSSYTLVRFIHVIVSYIHLSMKRKLERDAALTTIGPYDAVTPHESFTSVQRCTSSRPPFVPINKPRILCRIISIFNTHSHSLRCPHRKSTFYQSTITDYP